ncbi:MULTISPECIES: hypothetical protein [Pseudoalteromonas]|uniref:Uncharacterized protein n=1 Tax=Pseudoalteromonas obscura TaxID=3048491 RepID=A0ABT7EER2_9GAMM|nr:MULTISPECIES: hypothetical protein [Pseudoalteromonas]MBQ4839625.1 hypothetical protein [Pseudoalteromonas luteoviolacea]MDK2593769.1 hypothetical protein [Pseudoalteromonas sp. P94(2023)]
MANYQEAFAYAFSHPSEYLRGDYPIWRCLTLKPLLLAEGFSDDEQYTLFEKIYAPELWRQCKGDQITDQKVAGLLLLINAKGYLATMLKEMQSYFNITPTSQMCERTLYQLNRLPKSALLDWLDTGLQYFSLVQNKRHESYFLCENG